MSIPSSSHPLAVAFEALSGDVIERSLQPAAGSSSAQRHSSEDEGYGILPLRTTSPESMPPSPPSNRWKGKGRALDVIDSNLQLGTNPPSASGTVNNPLVIVSSPGVVYPPATDAVVEERKVKENLQRWEQLERQRRRAARESRSIETTATAMRPGGDIVRRGSHFWSAGKSRKPAPGSHPLPSDGEHNPFDDEEEPPDSLEAGVVRTPNATSFPQRPPPRHRTSSSMDSNTSDSSAATITPENRNAAGESSADVNPFDDPSSTSQSHPSSQTILPRQHPTSGSPPAPNPITTLPTAGELGLARPARYPTPKPLGLPLNAFGKPGSLLGKQEAQARYRTGTGMVADTTPERTVQQEIDDPDAAESGRWWTDWLCGCREGPDRGGDHQAGRTNPFE